MSTINQLLIAEATEYEFKAALESNKPRSWLKTVSAFANGVGGSIYIGVSDDGVAIGIDNPQQTAEQVSELIKARIDPAIKNVVLEPLIADGKHILRVLVSSGANTPYYYTGDGNKLAYYRIGNVSVPVSAAILNELVLNTRIEMPDYPPAAVHETLVNALVHRDYMIQGSEIHVDMYDDRIEIVSPGGMPDGKRIQDLNIDDVPSIRRNPVICDIFSRLKLMERRGSGLRKIIDEYPEDTAPVFRSTEQSFIVTLRNLNYYRVSMPNGIDDGIDDGIENGIDDGIEKHTVEIISAIISNSKITQKQLAAETGLSVRTIARELKRLRDEGVIMRIGSDRAGYWEVAKRTHG